MKTVIMGTSGSGKSTLAKKIGQREGAAVLHMDAVHFLPGWVERPQVNETALVEAFLDEHDAWVIDGNYTKTCYTRRLEEADRIVVLWFGRWTCLWRAVHRWWQNRGVVRDSSAPGCKEKIDLEFIWWILYDSRRPAKLARIEALGQQYPGKFTMLRNQRELDAFIRTL